MTTPDDPYAPRPENPADQQPGPTPPAPPAPPAPSPGYGAPGGTTPPSPSPYGQPGYSQPGAAQPGYGQPTYGQPAAAYPGYAGPYAQPSTKTNGLAIASLVCSLAAFAVCISAPVGLVLGIVALSQIKKSGEQGRGLAIAGAWIGGIFSAVALIGVVLVFAFSAWFVDEASEWDERCDRPGVTTEEYNACMDRQFEDQFNLE